MNTKTTILRGAWVRDTMPDSDVTVLMRLDSEEYPIWVGFHDGEAWCSADASSLADGVVIGWMHLDDAAKTLDAFIS